MPRERAQLDSVIEIVTPENISFRYELAGPFRRLPAFVIDLAVRAAAWVGAGFMLFAASVLVGPAGFGIMLVFWFLVEWFYGGLFETLWNGQTPGKRMMGIRVVSVEGHPISGLQAVMRNLLRGADMMPILPMSMLDEELALFAIPTFMIGLTCMAMNRRFQRLGDLVCGTMVVVEERSWNFGVAQIEDQRAAQLAELIPASFQFTRQLNRALTAYAERRRFFSAPRREEIAKHIARPLLDRFGLAADTNYDLFMCALYHRAFIADLGANTVDWLPSQTSTPTATADEMASPVTEEAVLP